MNTFLARIIRLSCLSIGFILTSLLAVVYSNGSQEIMIESEESKTETMSSVYNKIKYFGFKDRDVWMMNQSHYGPYIESNKWDRLAIVVNKTTEPYQASFYQLESGPLVWQENLKQLPYKVSCFMCHTNGPRAIRPNWESPLYEFSLKDRLMTFWWNLKIKSYGRVEVAQNSETIKATGKVPLKWMGSFENQKLQAPTCLKCHKESGFFARGALLRQNIPTIKFMLERGYMPPFGMSLSSEERAILDNFTRGF